MAYRTWNGAAWSGWSTEYEGALPDQLGIEIGVTDAVKVQVRITLTSADQESEDDAGDPVGSTPALFAVEIIARTTAFLTSSIPVSSSFEVVGIDADEKTSLQVLRDACEQVGWDFQVSLGALTIAESIGDEREVLFRAGSNMDISQLGDDAAEIINYLIANGTGSGINRPQITLKDTTSITSYGVRQLVKNFDIEDPDDLETAAQAYLDSVADPFFSWKIKTKFEYDNAPDFFTGDTVTVVDPKSATVQRSRIMQIILSYENDKLDTECYLGKTRANLVPKIVPIYRIASLSAPKSLALAATEKGLIAIVPKPDNSSLWAFTELYVKTSTGVTAIAENLVAKKRSTSFQLQGLLPKTRYYAKARYIDIYGRSTALTVEVTMETLKFSTPFEVSVLAGVEFENASKNVQILNNGTIKAINGEFVGTLKTGENASLTARVAIRDASGITVPIAFTGTGVDDMYIAEEGAVAGEIEVVIVASKVTYAIGDTGPGGGLIFYKSSSGGDDTYLECAPVGTEWVNDEWADTLVIIGTSTGVGTGQANTTAIVAEYPGQSFAANHCDDLVSGGKSDWFLPSKDELNLIYNNLHLSGLGEFDGASDGYDYWSSSEGHTSYAAAYAYCHDFYTDLALMTEKDRTNYARNVRAIRTFTIPAETFKWKETSGAYSADIDLIAGVETTLTGYDIKIAFGSESGHVVADKWAFTQGEMRGLSIMDSAGVEYISASAGSFYQNGMESFACKAWINYKGTSVRAINDSGNVSSVSFNSTGQYTVNFTEAMPHSNYGVSIGGNIGTIFNLDHGYHNAITTSIDILSRVDTTYTDAPEVCLETYA